MNEHAPTHLDLFSGIGGFAIAAQWAGFRTVGFCEIEPYAQQVLVEKFGAIMADSESQRCGEAGRHSERCEKRIAVSGEVLADATRYRDSKQQETHSGENATGKMRTIGVNEQGSMGTPAIHSNIFTLNGADYLGVSLITGGFPCQPFSVAGKRRGKEDDRHLWPEMLRVIAQARTAWVLGENVAGIVNMELDAVLSDLEGIGYAPWPLVVPACAVDARHRRDRVWIVAHAEGGGLHGNMQRSVKAARFEGGCSGVSHANVPGLQRQWKLTRGTGQEQHHAGDGCRWLPEPAVGRVAHGIPARSHRLKGLGNAIVPQVAYQILKEIRRHIT